MHSIEEILYCSPNSISIIDLYYPLVWQEKGSMLKATFSMAGKRLHAARVNL
jgi:hypothetical protein